MFHHLFFNEDGADLAEYALVLVLVSIAAIGAMTVLGTQVSTVFCSIVSTLGQATC